MKIFVIGASCSGKTTLAKSLSDKLKIPTVGISKWIRSKIDIPKGYGSKEIIDLLTKESLIRLRENPHAAIDYLKLQVNLEKSCIIEGVRNPYDFVHLFEPKIDVVVILNHTWSEHKTKFETDGLASIKAILKYYLDLEIIQNKQVISLGQNDPDCILDMVLSDLENIDLSAVSKAPPPIQKGVTVNIPKNNTHRSMFCREEFLYDMDPEKIGAYLPCKLMSVTSYEGLVPTFTIQLEDGSVFAALPPHAFISRLHMEKDSKPDLDIKDLVYHNCKSGPITIFQHTFVTAHVFLKEKNQWRKGWYLFSIEWYEGNDLLNCIILDNGQIAFMPYHKIKFGLEAPREFPKFKKLRHEWSV